MSLDAVNILGINITTNSKKQILEFIQKYLLSSPQKALKPLVLVTPNPEQVVYAAGDNHFRDILNRADVAIPDGVGIVWADKNNIKQTIPGIDFMEDLVILSVKQHVPIALIGSWGGLAVKAFDCLSKKHLGLLGWAVDGPEVTLGENSINVSKVLSVSKENTQNYFNDLARRIIDSDVRVVFVGLGAPKQEYFIEKLVHSLELIVDSKMKTNNPIILMSVGGSFDELAGKVPRAPEWASRRGLKWLWRLVHEPWRIKRQLALVQFVGMVIGERLSVRSK